MSSIFDKYEYVAYPATVLTLTSELRVIIDDYREGKLDNREIEEIILFYANNNKEKLFDEDELNITVQRKLGKQRLNVLRNILKKVLLQSFK
ncbi:TIGR04540 family protein [Streptococcus suis]|uniref:TIGR04540 family protein n=2 Tax=Streptococcus suis TaxID=1307 RepID=UPI0013747F2E|nr:TIGR04540 family protein [Streptococcus suis]WEW07461.1 hypothetical protein [Streptococcus suis]HEM6489882.1 TIGR04540 family protein [Streptococcus suis]